ncbi:MAG: ATP-dependent helicase, partial [Spirochaetales bacterium]|nr:ATP-dependent helicase [Spirochaetales bacterium]
RYIEERKRFLLLPTVPEAPAAPAELPPELAALAQEFGLPPPEPVLENVYREYRSRLREKRLLDFDDLVAGAARLLARRDGILLYYQKRFRHIFVDEYQDINFAQYALLRLLAPAATTTATENSSGEPAGLCVIGDPNQAIYGFRGADTRYIDRFSRDYPGAALYNLSQSFRCAAPILTAAGRLVGAHLEGPGHGVSLYRSAHPTEKAEAEGIARRISRLIGGTTFFAIDSRVSQPQGETEGTGGTQAAPLTSLGDCAILLRAAALSPPIEKALQDHGIPFHLIGEKPWREEARIYVDAVSILTMHAAKGLEFSHVFIAGLEDGILPFTLYDENPTSAVRSNEEKRLLYVAMTRAKTGLYLSWAATRIFRGRKLTANPSPFLADIENLIPKAACELPRREKDPQLTLF